MDPKETFYQAALDWCFRWGDKRPETEQEKAEFFAAEEQLMRAYRQLKKV